MTYTLASSSHNNPGPAVDDLHEGGLETMPLTVVAGTYTRGQVLSLNGNNLEAATLANQANARAIMPHDVTLAANALTAVYVAGHFNEEKIVLGTATLPAVKTALHGRGIFTRKWTPAT